MRVMLVTYTPQQRGLLGTVAGKWSVTVVEAESVGAAVDAAECPLHGEVRGVDASAVVTSRAVVKRERA